MITRLSFALLAMAVTLVPPRASAQEKEAAPTVKQVELKKGDHILFYGDSLTEQARGPKGWVTIVRETLKEKHPDLGVEVTTFAIGGYCIVDRVKRVDQEVLAKKPTIVVIQGGVPDALRYKRDQFKTGLEELIDALAESGRARRRLFLHQPGREARRQQPHRQEPRRVRRGRPPGGQRQEAPAQRSAQGLQGILEKAQSRQQGQRHPDARRQPFQRHRQQVRRRADAENVQGGGAARPSRRPRKRRSLPSSSTRSSS